MSKNVNNDVSKDSPMLLIVIDTFLSNSPGSICENCNMTSRLSDHISILGLVFLVLKSLLGIAKL